MKRLVAALLLLALTGCGGTPVPPVPSAPGRTYLTYRPATAGKDAPLVVVLHGADRKSVV